MTRRTLMGLTLGWSLAACGGAGSRPPVPVAADYDHTCSTDGDCGPVFIGNPGCCPPCPNDAVRVSEVNRAYADDEKARSCTLSPAPSCPAASILCPSPPLPAVCRAGKCQLWHHPSTISVEDYDRSCTSLADCAAVFVGTPSCCSDRCPNASIRAADVTLLMSDLEAASPVCTGVGSCPAPPPRTSGCSDGRVMCVAGVCAFESSSHDGGTTDADAAQEK